MKETDRPPARKRGFVAVAAGVAIMLATGGCTGAATDVGGADGADASAGASVSPPSDASSSSSASASASALPGGGIAATKDHPARDVPKPQMPKGVQDRSNAGAEEAARYYFSALRYLSLTGDAGPARDIAPDCEACRERESDYVRLYETGAWTTGARYEVSAVSTERVPESTAVRVQLRVANEMSRIHANPENHATEESREKVQQAIEEASGDGPAWRTDLDMNVYAYFDDELARWVVFDGPYWVYDTPHALEGFAMRERG